MYMYKYICIHTYIYICIHIYVTTTSATYVKGRKWRGTSSAA